MTTVEELARRGRVLTKVDWEPIDRIQFWTVFETFQELWASPKEEHTIGLVTNQPLIETTYRLMDAHFPMLKMVQGKGYQYFVARIYTEEEG